MRIYFVFIWLINTNKVIQRISTLLFYNSILYWREADFIFNEGIYKLSIEQDNYLTLYNPIKKLPVNISSNENSTFISIFITQSFHNLFSNDTKK